MKKILSIITLSIFLTAGSPKPAEAIVFDAGQIAAKVAEIVQDIADAVQTGIQEVNKVKQMAAQGFNYDGLIKNATDFAKKYAIDYVTHKILTKRFKQVERDTKAQNKKAMEKDKENYKEATEALYDKQIEIVNDEIASTCSAKNEAQSKMNVAKSNEASAKAAYEAEESPEAKNQKLMEYMKYSAEAEKYSNDYKELSKKCDELKKQQENLLQEKSKITSDEQYKALEKRINSMEDEENELITVDPGETEWDKVKAEEYDPSKRYEEFVKQYFFDPEELSNDVTTHQSRIDRIMRQRRYLVVNSAAHLMQVASSMRRSLPVEYKKNKEMFTSIGQDEGQLAAMEVYSATRVENARALLMYAKLLCAKLQYETARDLIKSDVQRREVDNTKFDLGKYILDSKDVEEMIKKFSYGEDAEEEKSRLNTDYNADTAETFNNY